MQNHRKDLDYNGNIEYQTKIEDQKDYIFLLLDHIDLIKIRINDFYKSTYKILPPGLLKSGIPHDTDIPAPDRTITLFASRIH